MKILVWTKWVDDIYLGTKPPDGIGGAEVQLAYWAKALADSGENVYTFGWRAKSLFGRLFGVKFLFIPWMRKVGVLFNPLRFLYLSLLNPDLVITRSSQDYLRLIRMKNKLGFKLVYMLASDKDVQNKNERVDPWQAKLKLSDLVIAQNEYQLKCISEVLNVNRYLLQPNVFDKSLFNLENISKKEYDFVWLGNLKRLKRPEWFIAIAKALPDYNFVMAGKAQEERYESGEFYKSINSLENLKYFGYLTLQESVTLLSLSKVLINTSEYEGFPNTFIQALNLNVGIISTVNPNSLLDKEEYFLHAKSLDEIIEKAPEILLMNINSTNQLRIGSENMSKVVNRLKIELKRIVEVD